jgi:Flp pilus assembly protein TadG
MSGDRGQAAVELLLVLPLLLAVGLAGGAIVAARAAQERADDAARAGAMALLQGGDPRDAARELLSPRDRDGVTVRARRVTVAITPRLPLHLTLPQLTARASADAGPEPGP